jgi:hypothetical protein
MIKATPVQIKWHPGLSIYASESFLKTVSEEYGWIGGIDDTGRLLCILPYCVIHKAMFRLIRFPVATTPLEGEWDVEEEKMFLDSVVDYFRSTKADLIIPATFNTIFRTYPDGAIAAPYGTYVLNLSQTEENLWKNLHQKHRNVIRNAEKRGVKIRSGAEHLETAYGLVRDSFMRSAQGFMAKRRIGFRMSYETFKHQVMGFGDYVRVFIAEHEGVVQGCAVVPFSDHSAYYMHGGGIANPVTGAMNLLQWEAIRQFRQLGVQRYDFFGARVEPEKDSKAEGIIRFKQRFGGEWRQGYMWKFPFNPLKYFLYSQAARLRSGGDVVDQEHHKLGDVSASGCGSD